MILEAGPLVLPGPRIIFANAGTSILTGCPVDELHGSPLALLGDEAFFAAFFEGLAAHPAGVAAFSRQGPIFSADGVSKWVEWKASPVCDPQGRPMNLLVTVKLAPHPLPIPVKAQKPGEASGLAEKSIATLPIPAPDEYQGDYVATIREAARRVAHEFNNALTRILMPVGMAARMAPEGSELHEKLHLAEGEAKKAAALAKDFLDCFRPRLPAKERCDLKELLGRVLRLSMASEDVEWELIVPDDLAAAEVDPEQIDRVLFNLVRNACDAMNHHGRLVVKAQNVTIPEDSKLNLPAGDYVSITVRDFGPGIAEEHLRHIFHSRFTTKAHGNGCGLPICHQIVKQHGGDLFVSSKVNVGTAFAIFLPAATAPTPERSAPVELTPLTEPTPVPVPSQGQNEVAATSPTQALPPLGRSLLIVDDDEIIRVVTQQIVQQLGYQADSASGGDEALDILRTRRQGAKPITSVLLDLNLRGPRDGYDTLDEIRRMDPSVKVIATSGEHGNVEDFRRRGFATFLPKPYSVELLDQTLRAALNA